MSEPAPANGRPPRDRSAGDDLLAYHLQELAVARQVGSPSRVMPDIPATARAVLDVGCGAGQTLAALDIPADAGVLRCGVDVDQAALAVGPSLDPGLLLACAPGEALPFADGSFDFVLSRVAIPYMDIARATKEMWRVLRPGGQVWLALHSIQHGMEDFRWHLDRRQPKGMIYQLYVLANGFTLHTLGRQFRFPFGARNMESVQTGRGMRRALGAAGFERVSLDHNRFFIVTAHKPALEPASKPAPAR